MLNAYTVKNTICAIVPGKSILSTFFLLFSGRLMFSLGKGYPIAYCFKKPKTNPKYKQTHLFNSNIIKGHASAQRKVNHSETSCFNTLVVFV